MADVQGDLLDLKAEVTNLKTKLFMSEQRRNEEVSAKTLEVSKLES